MELLRQVVGGLQGGAQYKLQWKTSAEVPGVAWRVNGETLTEFTANSETALLSLWYQRPIGEVRAEASFDLSGIALLPLH